jgi:radical SAM protein with 4Fe4S-binding SPASM domain
MGCPSQAELGSSAHLQGIRARVRQERIPLSGVFDLTYRCNYRCVHCYVGHLVACSPSDTGELSPAGVCRLLSQAAEEGCLFIVLSGGEPLLRPDFADIYRAARRLGLIVTVFTNASLVSEAHLDAFEEYPPHLVEVSVYGSTAATYERVTGRPGSYRLGLRGIERLVERGVRVGMKTMILRDNEQEVAVLERLAESMGLGFRLDPLVTARVDGDRAPLEQRVDPERAARIEFGSAKRRADTASFLGRYGKAVAESPGMHGRLYHCGAGVSAFHIDPRGQMHPCVVGRGFGYNASSNGFADAWREVTAAVERATWDGSGGCEGCSEILLCGYCPGLFALEGASPAQPPEYLCELGASRRRVLEQDAIVKRNSHVRAG